MSTVAGLEVYDRPADGTVGMPAATGGHHGAGRVVFAHGALDRGASFVKVARLLRDVHTTRYDRRGYGRSIDAGVAIGLDAQVDDLLAVVGTAPSVVVGHSLGAVLALAARSREPDLVTAVVAFEPPFPWRPYWPAASAGGAAATAARGGGPGAAAEAFMRRIVGDAVWDDLPERTRAARRAEGPALLAELAALRELSGPPFAVERLRGVTVVGHGGDTNERHRLAATELAEAIGTEARVIPCAGHGAHSSHPAAFTALVREALALAATHPGPAFPDR